MITTELCYIIQKVDIGSGQMGLVFHDQMVRIDGKERYCLVFNAHIHLNQEIRANAIYNGRIYKIVWEEYENLSIWQSIGKAKEAIVEEDNNG